MIVGKISSLRVRNVWIPERGVCVFTLIKLKTFDDFSTRMLCFCLLQRYFVCKKHQNFCSIRMWNVILLIITQEINLITRPQFPVPDQQLRFTALKHQKTCRQQNLDLWLIKRLIDYLSQLASKGRKGKDRILLRIRTPRNSVFYFAFFLKTLVEALVSSLRVSIRRKTWKNSVRKIFWRHFK